jgi:uncharacterized membrane protein YheB (UPF0754 family)
MVMKEDLFYLILSDNKFSNTLIKQFPGLYSYITSYRQNASEEHNQVCKDQIFRFYESDEYFKTFVSNYLKENQNSLRVDGRVIEVKNREEYLRLIRKAKAENWKYEGLSIVESNDKIKVYFY